MHIVRVFVSVGLAEAARALEWTTRRGHCGRAVLVVG